MNEWLREQLALRAANSKNIFTVYKHSGNGKVLTNTEHVDKFELPLPKERGFLLHRDTCSIATAEVRALHRLTPQSLRRC